MRHLQFKTLAGSIVEINRETRQFQVLRTADQRGEPLHLSRGVLRDWNTQLGKPATLVLEKTRLALKTSVVVGIREV